MQGGFRWRLNKHVLFSKLLILIVLLTTLWWRIFESNYQKECVFQFSLNLTFPPRKRLKLVQFAKCYFFDEWSSKRVAELELLPDSLLSFEFINSFWGAWFSLALSFLTGLVLDSQIEMWCFLLQAKQRCWDVQF